MAPSPKLIGKYEILEELGRGGFAVVYKARDVELDRIVALKVLRPALGDDPDFVARFKQEARAAARLKHPHVVTIYDATQIDGQLIIAMQYVEGHTLREELTQGAMPFDRALTILEQIASALDYAHQRGVVHRDVKPANILLEETGQGVQATLLDFGLAKAMEASTALTSQGTLLGSPEYMAPEQADPNRAKEIGPATDRYALGIVAYQLLTGRVPFPGNTPATLNAHLNLKPPDPRTLRSEVSPQVSAVLLKMLAKAPADRYASANEFTQALRSAVTARVRASQPAPRSITPAPRPEASAPVRPIPRKTSRWVWVLVGLLAVMGVMLIGMSLISQNAERDRLAAQIQKTSVTQTAVAMHQRTDVMQMATIETSAPPSTPTLAPTDTPAPTLAVPSPTPLLSSVYRIKAGDTLFSIARLYNLTIDQLLALNPGLTRDSIFSIGQVINVGGPSTYIEKLGDTHTRGTDGMTMVYVPAGTFQMGSETGGDDEKPVHFVALDRFWFDRTEVTNAQYAKCVAAQKCAEPAKRRSNTRDSYYDNPEFADYPVIYVSWDDANEYCKWAGGQLPTEAQWEYAARGPNAYAYPWGNDWPDKERLNYSQNAGDTTAVGSYPRGASWVDALDMAGNVWEWVNDWYGSYSDSSQTDPTGPATGDFRALRGGSWRYGDYYVRTAYRVTHPPDGRDADIGFRCAMLLGN